MLAIARNNHINLPYRNTNRSAVHCAVPTAPTLSTIAGIEATFDLLFDSLALKSLLVGAGSRVSSDTNLTISVKRLLTTWTHYWESHPFLKVVVFEYILTQTLVAKILPSLSSHRLLQSNQAGVSREVEK